MRTFHCKIIALTGLSLVTGLGAARGQVISDGAISNLIVAVANHWQRTLADGSYPAATTISAAQSATKPAGIEWDYPWGVNLYGQLRVQDATGNTNAENFALDHNLICARYYAWLMSLTNTLSNTSQLANFQKTNAVLGTFFGLDRLDYCGAMSSQLLEGALRHGGGLSIPQLQMIMVTANYISTVQARLPDGTLYRPDDQNAIWADDLFMSCPFLIRWYEYTGDTNYLNDAAQQVMNFAGYLQDTNGIWYHGYYLATQSVNGVKWGRANGWAMLTTAEILSVMPTNHPARANLLAILRKHIAGIESVQAPDGLWHQVLDHPEVWEETSCSAMFSGCIARAVNRGWIDATNLPAARRGFAAIAQMEVTPAGVISNICPGTSLSTSLPFYTNKISLPPSTDDPHGPGPVMLAGAELLLTPQLGIAAAGGSATVSWNAGLDTFNLQTSADLTDWSAWNGSTVTTNWQNSINDTGADGEFFRLSLTPPGYPPTPLSFEAESLAFTTNGATAAVSALDTNASGGHYVTLNSGGAGAYIEFTLTNVPAGAYDCELAFKCGSNRGQLNVLLDGNPFGATLDEYWPLGLYPLWDFGAVTLATSGNHTVRLTVSGKNAASSSYTLTADKILLTPR